MTQSANPDSAIRTLAWKICLDENRSPVVVDNAEERAALQAALQDGRLLEGQDGVRFFDEHALVLSAADHFLDIDAESILVSPHICFEK